MRPFGGAISLLPLLAPPALSAVPSWSAAEKLADRLNDGMTADQWNEIESMLAKADQTESYRSPTAERVASAAVVGDNDAASKADSAS